MSANDRYDWTQVTEASPNVAVDDEWQAITGKQFLKFLEVGAVGGGVIGILAAFVSDAPFLAALVVGVIAGAAVWTCLSVLVETTRRSRSFLAGIVRVLYGFAIVAYTLAVIGLIGIVIYVKANIAERPTQNNYVERATIN